MKFTIEILSPGQYILYDKDGGPIPAMDADTLAYQIKNNQIKNAETVTMTYLKTNSGIVIIGGRPYYIP